MTKRLLTHVLGLYSELVPTATNGWIAPEENRIWTPQQDVIIVGCDFASVIRTFDTDLSGAGSQEALLKLQASLSSAFNTNGQFGELDNNQLISSQGGITNSGPTRPAHANKYVPAPPETGQLVLSNTDFALWVFRFNDFSNYIR